MGGEARGGGECESSSSLSLDLERETSRALTSSSFCHHGRPTPFSERGGMLSLPLEVCTPEGTKAETGGGGRCPLSALGECAAETCGCHRVNVPQARARLEHVVSHFVMSTQKKTSEKREKERSTDFKQREEEEEEEGGGHEDGLGLVYASVGSGYLLSDAVMLEKLRGLPAFSSSKNPTRIRTCVLVDTLYDVGASAGGGQVDEMDMKMNAMLHEHERKRLRLQDALKQFTAWMKRSKTNVRIFDSLDKYKEACRLDPMLKADLFLQCDAAAIEKKKKNNNNNNDTKDVDAVLLVGNDVLREGGMFFRLNNHGRGGHKRIGKKFKCQNESKLREEKEKENIIDIDKINQTNVIFEARDDLCLTATSCEPRREKRKMNSNGNGNGNGNGKGKGEMLPFSIEVYKKVPNRKNLLVVMDKVLQEETPEERDLRYHMQRHWALGFGGLEVFQVVFSPRIAVRRGAGLSNRVEEVLKKGDQIISAGVCSDADGNQWLQLVQGIPPGKLLLQHKPLHPLPGVGFRACRAKANASSCSSFSSSLYPYSYPPPSEAEAKAFRQDRGFVMWSHPKHGQLVKKVT